jgi:2-hydroxychromene-2-carboxylate isomerase
MADADINFYFDPLCPFAWMTSKWVRLVTAQRDYHVDWRFISLRMINANVDYGSYFPAGYAAGHTAGLRLLRVAARTRAPARPGRGRPALRRDRRPRLRHRPRSGP